MVLVTNGRLITRDSEGKGYYADVEGDMFTRFMSTARWPTRAPRSWR